MENKIKSVPTLAILTGGGDVPGLNPCIKTLVYRAASEGIRVLGIRRGWAGILEYNRDDPASASRCVQELHPAEVRTIDRSGGTYLHTSRTNPSAAKKKDVPDFLKKKFKKGEEKKDFTPHVLDNLSHLEVDAIIPIGGDDTLSFADRLHKEGFPVIAIPKTMDNDVFGTDYCIGFSTAVTRAVTFIHALRTSTGSHERIAVIELFGRYCGETSLIAAYLAGVDRAIISEVPFDPEETGRPDHGGQEGQPQELCHDHHFRRGQDDQGGHDSVRRVRCLRPQETRRYRRGDRRPSEETDR